MYACEDNARDCKSNICILLFLLFELELLRSGAYSSNEISTASPRGTSVVDLTETQCRPSRFSVCA